MKTPTNSKRPVLEEPETVTSGGDPGFIGYTAIILLACALLLLGAMLYSLAFPHSKHTSWLSKNDYMMALAMLGAVCVALIAAIRSPLFDYYWETSSEGLYYQGTLRRGLILWTEVTKAETKWVNVILRRRHVVRGGGQVVAVPHKDAAIASSILQHLERVEMSNGIRQPGHFSEIWNANPASIPEGKVWENPQPPDVGLVIIKLALELGVGLTILLLTDNKIFAYTVAVIIGVLIGQTGSRMGVARRISIRRGGIEVTIPWRTVSSDWDAIKSATWGTSGLELNLQLAWHTTIHIPCNFDDADSVETVISIIRRLRQRSKPLALSMPEESEE